LIREKNQIEKELVIKKLKKIKNHLRKEYGIEKIGLFGSLVRNEQNESSDIDLLIEIQAEMLSLIKYMKLKFFLEDVLGRKVDLVLNRAIKPRLRERILREVIYV